LRPGVTENHAKIVRGRYLERGACFLISEVRGQGPSRRSVAHRCEKLQRRHLRGILSHIGNFWEKRVWAFLEKLKIQPWQDVLQGHRDTFSINRQ
jgi:hypothetical protein